MVGKSIPGKREFPDCIPGKRETEKWYVEAIWSYTNWQTWLILSLCKQAELGSEADKDLEGALSKQKNNGWESKLAVII